MISSGDQLYQSYSLHDVMRVALCLYGFPSKNPYSQSNCEKIIRQIPKEGHSRKCLTNPPQKCPRNKIKA